MYELPIKLYDDKPIDLLPNQRGCIYFIKLHHYVKIGHTNNPITTRLQSIRTHSPYGDEATIIRLILGDRGLEKSLHEYFAPLHHAYEWFHYNDEMLRVDPNKILNRTTRYSFDG